MIVRIAANQSCRKCCQNEFLGQSRLNFKLRLIFHKFEFQPHTASGAVVERPELLGRDIVLHVTRIPVIGDVEDRESGPTSVLFAAKRNPESFGNQQVQRQQSWKASTLITWTNKILLLVQK